MLVGQVAAKPICHFLGYFYPAYQSYKAVKANDPALYTQWLTYWIVSTYFSLAELVGDTLLSWMPLYYELKVALLVWLVAPQFKGATKIYQKILYPFFHRYERDIDDHVDSVKKNSSKRLGELAGEGIRHIRIQSADLISKSIQRFSSANSDSATGNSASRD